MSESALSLRAHCESGRAAASPGSELIELFTLLTGVEVSRDSIFSCIPFIAGGAVVPSELWMFLEPPGCGAPGCFLDLKRNAISHQIPSVLDTLAVLDKVYTTGVLDETWPLPTLQLHSHLDSAQQGALFARHQFLLDMRVFDSARSCNVVISMVE